MFILYIFQRAATNDVKRIFVLMKPLEKINYLRCICDIDALYKKIGLLDLTCNNHNHNSVHTVLVTIQWVHVVWRPWRASVCAALGSNTLGTGHNNSVYFVVRTENFIHCYTPRYTRRFKFWQRFLIYVTKKENNYKWKNF